jgi:hypothetical protein
MRYIQIPPPTKPLIKVLRRRPCKCPSKFFTISVAGDNAPGIFVAPATFELPPEVAEAAEPPTWLLIVIGFPPVEVVVACELVCLHLHPHGIGLANAMLTIPRIAIFILRYLLSR